MIDIERAIERREMRLYYQPIVSLRNGAIVGFEGLVRWLHPEQGLLLPASFLPGHEAHDAMLRLNRWALRQACEQARFLQAAESRQALFISVNVELPFLKSQECIEELVGLTLEYGLAPFSLAAEISEPQLMMDVGSVSKGLQFLDRFGIHIYLDNFGTGFSSISLLAAMPIARIKVDGSFVAALENGGKAEKVLKALLGIGRNLERDVIAAGIETPEQVEFLQHAGCQLAQGFYFSAPLDVDASVWLRRLGIIPVAAAETDAARLRCFDLFADLDDDILTDIADRCGERQVPTGTVLIRQGQVGNEVYLLQEGSVEVYREQQQSIQPLAVLRAPAVFGEMAVVNPERIRTAYVRALTDLKLVTIPVDAFLYSLRRWPAFKVKLLKLVASRTSR